MVPVHREGVGMVWEYLGGAGGGPVSTIDANQVTSGQFDDARISESSVEQHLPQIERGTATGGQVNFVTAFTVAPIVTAVPELP